MSDAAANRRRTIEGVSEGGDPRHAQTPEQHLLGAILDRALGDLEDGGRNADDALDWLQSDESGPTFGGWDFRALCGHLGISPEYLRENLVAVNLASAKRRRRVLGSRRRVVGE